MLDVLQFWPEKLMAVPQQLLDILACPICHTPVKLVPDKQTDKQNDKQTGQQGLKCATCGRVYPIRDDIPVMLVDEARIEKD
jgi:hypothetical protein